MLDSHWFSFFSFSFSCYFPQFEHNKTRYERDEINIHIYFIQDDLNWPRLFDICHAPYRMIECPKGEIRSESKSHFIATDRYDSAN